MAYVTCWAAGRVPPSSASRCAWVRRAMASRYVRICVVKAWYSGQPCNDVILVMRTRCIAVACPDQCVRLAAGHAIPRCLGHDSAVQP